jgi:hypothetical protein
MRDQYKEGVGMTFKLTFNKRICECEPSLSYLGYELEPGSYTSGNEITRST